MEYPQEIKSLCLIALSHLLQNIPKQVMLGEVKTVIFFFLSFS